jgi:hypothetical protein
MKAPDKLRLYDGELACDSRPDAQTYLRAWMKERKMQDGEAVCLIRRDDLQRLYDELLMQRECILCA